MGELIVILIVAVAVFLAARSLWKGHKTGGSCSGCSGGCSSCHGCAGHSDRHTE